jgi:hypothetical protein
MNRPLAHGDVVHWVSEPRSLYLVLSAESMVKSPSYFNAQWFVAIPFGPDGEGRHSIIRSRYDVDERGWRVITR